MKEYETLSLAVTYFIGVFGTVAWVDFLKEYETLQPDILFFILANTFSAAVTQCYLSKPLKDFVS